MRFSRFPFQFLPLLLSVVLISSARAQGGFQYLDDEAEAGGFDITAQLTKLPVEWNLAEQENGDAYRLRITSTSVELSTVTDKKPRLLASANTTLAPGNLVIQRRGVKWKVIADNRLVLQAEDDSWNEGKIGYRGNEVKDARVQPIEPIVFDDDFMRVAKDVALAPAKEQPRAGPKVRDTKTEETIWQATSGAWATTGINENEQAGIAHTANPFAFQSKTKGINFAIGGRPFWSDYRIEAAIRPQDAASVGLALYAQDGLNYLLLEWQKDGALLMKEIVNGQQKTVVAQTRVEPYDNKNWYRLGFAATGGALRAFIDDNEVLRGQSTLFGRGQVGLYTRNEADASEKSPAAVFDDVRVRSMEDFEDDFSQIIAGRWQPVAGSWTFTNAAVPANQQGAFTVMGEADWQQYTASADVTLPADSVAGLVVHHITGEGAYVFRVAGSKANLPYAGKAQILKIGGGKSETLSEVAVGASYDNSNLRWSFGSERGYLQGRVLRDGKSVRVIDAFDTSLEAGRAGLYAQRGKSGVPTLKNFALKFPRERKTWAVVPDLYSTDREAETMGGWSTPEGLWLPDKPVRTSATPTPDTTTNTTPNPTPDPAKTFWHKGAFWGDGDVRVKLPDLKSGENLTLVFGNTSRDTSTAPLKLVLKFETGTLAAEVLRGATKLGTGSLKIEGEIKDQPLEVSRRGRYLILRTGPQDEQSTLLVAKVS